MLANASQKGHTVVVVVAVDFLVQFQVEGTVWLSCLALGCAEPGNMKCRHFLDQNPSKQLCSPQ